MKAFLGIISGISLVVQMPFLGWSAGPVSRDQLCLWLDAQDCAAFELCSNRVVRWHDKSEYHHTLDAEGNPRFFPSVSNGCAAVRFSGHERFHLPSLIAHAGPVTVFVVSRRLPEQAGGTGWQRLVSIRSGSKADNQPPNFCLSTDAGTDAYAPTVQVMSKDAVESGAVSIGAVGGISPAKHGFQGDIFEVLVYDRGFVSEGALRDVLDYLSKKWGARVDRRDAGWTRVGGLGVVPEHHQAALPLADQQNRAGWERFEPFSDEFNGMELDATKWEPMRAWKGRPPGLFRSTNVALSNGCLALTMRKETVPEMAKDSRYHDYTSAIVETTQFTRYGYFEVRARPMNSAGSSAFWFAGAGKAWRIEIDVFEIGGKALQRERAYNMNAHVFREHGQDGHWNAGGVWQAPWLLAEGFHVYGLEWSPERLVYHVDGVAVRSMPNTHWHAPMRMIFDSETMPDWFGLPADGDLPSTYLIDYVRAWKKAGYDGVVRSDQLDACAWTAPVNKEIPVSHSRHP